MKKRTSTISDTLPSPIRIYTLAILVFASFMTSAVQASDGFLNILPEAKSICEVGFADTWIINQSCDIGGPTNIKTDDAIHIQCDSVTKKWSIDFYEEPANADPDAASSQAVRRAVCPGNGYLAKGADGKLILQCNYWESESNVAKQLEFELVPQNGSNHRSMRWLSRDINNPNVVCEIAGRADDSVIGGAGSN